VRSFAAAERICDAIRTTFRGQDVPRAEYAGLIAAMPGADPDDHLHAAAAVARSPATILTHNVRHFPATPLARRGVTVRRPDEYLAELAAAHADEIAAAVSQMAADRRRPSMSVDEVLRALGRAGVPRFALHMRTHLFP